MSNIERIDLTEERVRDLLGLKGIRVTKIERWCIAPQDLEQFVRSRRNR